eukprot:SAG31_NODE_12716_length_922_cov_0.759417_1_plen_51_part_10
MQHFSVEIDTPASPRGITEKLILDPTFIFGRISRARTVRLAWAAPAERLRR